MGAVDVVAWVGLLGSWVALLAILKLVFLTLRVLQELRQLADMTRDAARQLADNVADEQAFAALEQLAGGLAGAVRGLPLSAAARPPRVSSLSPGLRSERP
ncbi:MAG: hypothetical protein KY461_06095 [Actinobacteria bacterium]|nr:hypothetical protein [Actinomycetota bacterium]